jgi:hypothetical protein
MEIINYTRYSTEDLQAMVRTVEAFSGFSSWRPGIAKLVFKEFDPKNPYITTRQHRYNPGAPKEKRYVSKMLWRDMTAVGLIVPGKLFANPLEALALGNLEVAPADMVAKIVETLVGRANVAPYNAKLATSHLSLRVLKKAETKKPKADPTEIDEARKSRTQRNLQDLSYDVRRAQREVRKGYAKHVSAATHHLRAKQTRLEPIRVAYKEAMDAMARLEATIDSIASEV